MAFTAKLGISDSQLGNIVLGFGAAEGSGVEAASVWEFGGTASGWIPADAFTTQIAATAIVGAADQHARSTQVAATAIVGAADQHARTTELLVTVIYTPLASAGVWAFGGSASYEAPPAIEGTWEFAGRAVGLVDGSHVASPAAGGWELKGEATGRATGNAYGAGVWEFGGTCTIQEGTSEACITADGTAERQSFGVGRQANYVF